MGFEIIDKMFKEENPDSIFEVGITAGSLFKPYYEEKKGLIVGGVDIHPVTAAKEMFPECADNFYQFDASQDNWPIPDNSFDIVFTVGTLLTIHNPFRTLKEMMRMAKDKIIIAEQHKEGLGIYGEEYNILTSQTRKVLATDEQNGNYHYHRITRDYKEVFEKLGWKYELSSVLLDKTIFKCKKQ